MLAYLTLTLALAGNPGPAAIAGSPARAAEESLLAAARVDLEARVQELGLSGAAPLVGIESHFAAEPVKVGGQPATPQGGRRDGAEGRPLTSGPA